MYAVIKTGGKQHKVKAGDVIEVELIRSDGDTVTFTPAPGRRRRRRDPLREGSVEGVVTAKLVGSKKGEKVKIFKYRPKTATRSAPATARCTR